MNNFVSSSCIFSMFVCLLLHSLLLLLLGLSKSCSSQLNPSSSFSCFLIKLCKIQVATIMFLYSLMSQDDICFKIFHLFFHILKVHSITILSDEWTMLNFSSRWFPIFKGLTKDAFLFSSMLILFLITSKCCMCKARAAPWVIKFNIDFFFFLGSSIKLCI